MNNSNVLVSSTDHNPLKQLNDFKPQQQSAKRTATVWSQIFGSNRLIYHKNTRRVTYLSASTSYKCLLRDHSAVELTQLDKHCYRTLADVPADMDHYLMDLFWNKYNSILRVVDQNAFCKDQKSGGSASYSGFLHLVCLAMAVRFADKNRTGIKQIMADDKHSVFHREAKFLLDRELDNPQGCTVIQAVLILSDLESACGRDDLAAMHITTSCHLAFDFGLNIDCSSLELPETEMTFRRSLLRSCIIYDQAWALYLGRPTNIKLADISSVCLTSNTGSSLSSSPSGLQHAATNESASSHEDLHGQILDALLELSTLSAEIQALSQPILSPGAFGEESRLPDIAMLNTKLKAWAANLPPRLTWTAENIKDASRVFFLMQ